MAAVPDHDRIREVEDRSWTAQLVEIAAARATSDEDREAAFETLRVVEDHRCVAPLIAMLEDRSLDEDIRRAAAAVLDDIDDTSTLSDRGRWWDSGDDILRAHALGQMGRSEADLVVAVALDDRGPLQAYALEAMAFDFAEREFADVLVRALGHGDETVRRAAAETMVWDEWVAAEEPLLVAGSDPSPTVAEAALRALSWYPTRRVLRAISELEPHEDPDVRDQAEETYATLVGHFERVFQRASPAQRQLLMEWMVPVADLVDLAVETQDEEDSPAVPASPTTQIALPVPAHEIQAMLADPDGEWKMRKATLHQVDWAGHSELERTALRADFTDHPDPWIRWFAAAAFGAWGDRDALILQLLDSSNDVRKEATVQLGQLASDPALAPILWARMLGATGAAADAALTAYVVHAPEDEVGPQLAALARDEQRQHVRIVAIESLGDLGLTDEIRDLAPLLAEEPGVTWDVHVALLDAMAAATVDPPSLDRLLGVDQLEVIESIAELQAARTGS